MITAILLLALIQPQDPGLGTAAAPNPSTPAVRTEKLTPAEVKALADANQAVADAQDKLIHAKAALQGTTEGIEQAHHANTDCGCYLESTGGIMTRWSSRGTRLSSTIFMRRQVASAIRQRRKEVVGLLQAIANNPFPDNCWSISRKLWWAAPFFFGPRTLGRTWGTRPTFYGFCYNREARKTRAPAEDSFTSGRASWGRLRSRPRSGLLVRSLFPFHGAPAA
jgi:hypothetical protein